MKFAMVKWLFHQILEINFFDNLGILLLLFNKIFFSFIIIMVHNTRVTSQSSVIFARFQTSEPLALAKLAKVQNHVHDLAFAQQVSARILGAGDLINPYQVAMGAKDSNGDDLSMNSVIAAGDIASAGHRMVAGTSADSTKVGLMSHTSSPQQPNWALSLIHI